VLSLEKRLIRRRGGGKNIFELAHSKCNPTIKSQTRGKGETFVIKGIFPTN
jgi:hypothetical protein